MSALALGLIAAAAWGFHDFLVRFITQKVPISACIFTVLVTGLLMQGGLTLATDSLGPLPPAALWSALGAGVCFTIGNFGLYSAFQRGPLWLAAPVVACFSILSVGWAVFNGSQVSPLQWLAVGAVLLGISMVAGLAGDTETEVPPKGPTILHAAIAAFGFAGAFAFGQATTELSNEMLSALATRVFAIIATVGVILGFRLTFWPGRNALWVLAIMGAADSIAILSVVSAGGMKDAQYAVVAASMYGLPAIWLASTFLKERLNLAQWAGCLIAFAGVGYIAL